MMKDPEQSCTCCLSSAAAGTACVGREVVEPKAAVGGNEEPVRIFNGGEAVGLLDGDEGSFAAMLAALVAALSL